MMLQATSVRAESGAEITVRLAALVCSICDCPLVYVKIEVDGETERSARCPLCGTVEHGVESD